MPESKNIAGRDERLDEIVTNPSSLMKWAKSPEAAGMVVGFEAEMLIEDLAWPGDDETSEDESRDEPMPDLDGDFGNVSDAIENWFENGNDFHEGSLLRRALKRLERDYYEFCDRHFEPDDYRNRIRDHIADDQGVDEDDPLVDEIIDGQTQAYRNAVSMVKSEIYEDDDSWADFLRAEGLDTMRDFARAEGLDWPYMISPESSKTPEDMEASFVEFTGYDCTVNDSYHGSRPRNSFVMEPDSSLSGEDGYGGLELISPPMPLPSALVALDKVFSWMRRVRAVTSMRPATGFHIGVSMPSKGIENLDKLKLILMMGDEHVLRQFGRERLSSYAASSLKHIRNNLEQPGFDVVAELSKFRNFMDIQAAKDIKAMITGGMRRENTVSVRPSAGYVEFRSPGGDYLKQQGEIELAVLRFARALAIASDPEAERKEYAKKLYQLLTASLDSRDGTIDAFAAYSSGMMSKEDLLQAVRQSRSSTAAGAAMWNVVDRSGKIVGKITADDRNLMDKLAAFAGRNNLDARSLDAVRPGKERKLQTFRVTHAKTGDRFDIDAKTPAEALRYAKSRWGIASAPDSEFTVVSRT